MTHNPADNMTKKLLADAGMAEPETRKVLATVDCHRHADLIRLTVTHGLKELNENYELLRKTNGKWYIQGRHGQIGCNSTKDQPGFGTKIIFSSGVGSHSKSTGPNNDSDCFRTMNSCEVAVITTIGTKNPSAPIPNGLTLADKMNISPEGMEIIESLYDYQFKRLVEKQTKTALSDHVGAKINEFVTQAVWLIKGFMNLDRDNHISIYEDEPCFESLQKLYLLSGKIQVCSCQSNCKAKKAVLSYMGLTLDFIEMIDLELGVLLPLTHFFLKESVDIMMNLTTPCPESVGVYIFNSEMPRNFILNSYYTASFLKSGKIKGHFVYGRSNNSQK